VSVLRLFTIDPFSLQTYDRCRTSKALKGLDCEIFQVLGTNSLLQNLALDFISSFMLGLVRSNKSDIKACLKGGENSIMKGRDLLQLHSGSEQKTKPFIWTNSFCESLAQVCIKHGFTRLKRDALMTVIPAFIAYGLLGTPDQEKTL
jgi:hypothetical protein